MATDLPLGVIQRVVGNTLIPRAREAQTNLIPPDDALAIALELAFTAYAMKAAHRPGALLIVRRFAERCGLDGNGVVAYAAQAITEAVDSAGGD